MVPALDSEPSRSGTMTTGLPIRGISFRIFLLMGLCVVPGARELACGQDVSETAKAALKERDRLWDESQKLQAAGKTAEAIAAAEAMLAIERKVLRAGHTDLAGSLEFLAGLQL